MWTQEQLNEYAETGFLLLPGLLTSEETSELNDAVDLLMDGRYEEDLMHRKRKKPGLSARFFCASPEKSSLEGSSNPYNPLVRSYYCSWRWRIG